MVKQRTHEPKRDYVCGTGIMCPWRRTESDLTYKTLIVEALIVVTSTLGVQKAQYTNCFVQKRIHWKYLISYFSPLPVNFKLHIFIKSHEILTVHFIHAAWLHTEFQMVLLKKWESIIGTQALHIISIFIWRITPHRPDNLATQIPSLSVLWSHSGWSRGWADSAWKAVLFNEQWRAWVRRQQVERRFDALQLGMGHFSRQLSAWIIII